MNLRDKYNHAIQTAKGFRMEGSAEERDGKLYFKGMVKNQDEVNKIWDAIKTVPDWRNDVVAEVTIDPNAKAAATYTVKAGDTLSKIAKEHLGDAGPFRPGGLMPTTIPLSALLAIFIGALAVARLRANRK